MRFVKMLAASAALACAGMAGHAQANVTVIGSAQADSSGYFSIPLEMTKLGGGYRLRFFFQTPFAVTSQVKGTIVENLYTPPNRGFELKQTLVSEFESAPEKTAFREVFLLAGNYAWWRARSDTWSEFTNPVAALNIYTDPGALVPYTLTLRPVPEPATWALMIVGFGAIGTSVRRRTRARSGVAARALLG